MNGLATYGHEQLAQGAEPTLADCLRSAADAIFLKAERIHCRVIYEGTIAGPYPLSRLFDADEVADHLKELAHER